MLLQKKSDLTSKPEFIVIAGPNGAGKSTTSPKILELFGAKAFDWDKQFQLKWGNFNYDPVVIDGVREAVNADFQSHIEKSFIKGASVAYETNFHSDYNFELASRARNLGYNCSLYFLAITDAELGIERVADRVQKGGHHVSEPTIRERFQVGLEMLDNKASLFYDRIFIYDSGQIFRLLLVIENEEIVYKAENLEPKIIDRLPNIKSQLKDFQQ